MSVNGIFGLNTVKHDIRAAEYAGTRTVDAKNVENLAIRDEIICGR